jgi:hypothetical protein
MHSLANFPDMTIMGFTCKAKAWCYSSGVFQQWLQSLLANKLYLFAVFDSHMQGEQETEITNEITLC